MEEIEGQGSYEIADGFRAYKTYGNIESKTLYDMVVGYDVQKFLIEDGKLCAVLIDRNFVAQNIRVVLKTNGFRRGISVYLWNRDEEIHCRRGIYHYAGQ